MNLARQAFLGEKCEQVFARLKVGIIGLGGGGSHVAQQLAHLGILNFVLVDPQGMEDTNLNRLVGATERDVLKGTPKVDIAERVIFSIRPKATIIKRKKKWQEAADDLKICDVIIAGLDSVRAKDELDGFARRFLIPYIDMGMDVHRGEVGGYFIGGQVVLSCPGTPCLRCFGVVTQAKVEEESRQYGEAGPNPQVVWPNGVLASTAVGLLIQLVSPWHPHPIESAYFEYDGNRNTLMPSAMLKALQGRPCPHHSVHDTGDPSFDIRKNSTSSVPVKKGQGWGYKIRKVFGLV